MSNFADEIVEIKGNYIDFLDELKPDIVVKGLEHSELLDPLEMNLLNSYGAKFISIRVYKETHILPGLEGNKLYYILNISNRNLIKRFDKLHK